VAPGPAVGQTVPTPTTIPANPTATTIAPAVLPFVTSRTTAPPTRPGAASAPGPTPTTTPCRNSQDPACGPFVWDPDPGPNQPLSGQVTYSPASPRAGDTVTFHFTANDPDDDTIAVCNFSYGDGQAVVCDPYELMVRGACPDPHGPWTPPARKPGTYDYAGYPHTYQQPGTYDASFDLHSGHYCNTDPYASSTTLHVRVIVSP